jgi:hypothetical protein
VALRGAGLTNVPELVFALGEAARVLDASENAALGELTSELGTLTRLSRLICDRCGVAVVAWASLPCSLTVVSLDSNSLTSLPPALGRLVALKRLSVAHNALTSLPDELGLLRHLASLDVSHNRLSALPESLGGCSALEELHVSANELTALPTALALCPRLVLLDANCNIELAAHGIPHALLRDAASLCNLHVHGCAVTALQMREMPGYGHLEARRQAKATQALRTVGATGGFGESADAEMKRRV